MTKFSYQFATQTQRSEMNPMAAKACQKMSRVAWRENLLAVAIAIQHLVYSGRCTAVVKSQKLIVKMVGFDDFRGEHM